jgi:glycosyltransferase involved in cell wall biosynthesis
MKAWPKVSIQIPCYRQEHEIIRAIQSALSQDYPNLEVVVCDDRSPDSTFQQALSIEDSRLTVHQNVQNLGRVGNYRRLLYELVSGEWVVNLDGDDWFTDSQFISRAIELLLKNPDVVFYHANQKNLKAVKKYCQSEYIDEHHLKMDGMNYLTNHHFVRYFNHLSTIYKRSFALKANFYSMDALNADFTSIMRLCSHGALIQSNYSVGTWNLNAGSASLKYFEEAEMNKNKMALSAMVNYLSQTQDEAICRRILNNLIVLQDYFCFQAKVLFLPRMSALKILFTNFKFSSDYFKILLQFIAKRIFAIR